LTKADIYGKSKSLKLLLGCGAFLQMDLDFIPIPSNLFFKNFWTWKIGWHQKLLKF